MNVIFWIPSETEVNAWLRNQSWLHEVEFGAKYDDENLRTKIGKL